MADVVVILEPRFVYKDRTKFMGAIRAARQVSDDASSSEG
jgi:hypothetical protein